MKKSLHHPIAVSSKKRHIPYDPTKVQPRVLPVVVEDEKPEEDSDCSAKFSDEEEEANTAPTTTTLKTSSKPTTSSVSEKLRNVFQIINLSSSSITESLQKSCDNTPLLEGTTLTQSSSSSAITQSSTPDTQEPPIEKKELPPSDVQVESLPKKIADTAPSTTEATTTTTTPNGNSLEICENHLSEEKKVVPPSKEKEPSSVKEKSTKGSSAPLKGKENKEAKELKNSEKSKSDHPRERKSSKDEKKRLRERSGSKDSKEKVIVKDVNIVSSKVKDFKSSIKDKEDRKSKEEASTTTKSSEKSKQAKTQEQQKKVPVLEKAKKESADSSSKKSSAKDTDRKKPSKSQETSLEKSKPPSQSADKNPSPDKKKQSSSSSSNPEKSKTSEKSSTESSKTQKSSDSAKATVKPTETSSKTKSRDSENSSSKQQHSEYKTPSDTKLSRQSSSENSSIDRHNDSSNSSEKFSSRSSQDKSKPKTSSTDKVKNSSTSSSSSLKKGHSTSSTKSSNDKKQASNKRPKEDDRAESKKQDSSSHKTNGGKSHPPKDEDHQRPTKMARKDSKTSKPSVTKMETDSKEETDVQQHGLKRKNGRIKSALSNPELENLLNALGNSLDKPDETLKECWEIFNEEELLESNEESPNKKVKLEEEISEDTAQIRKKRLAHQPELKRDKVHQVKPARPSAFQVMQQRLLQVQQLQKSDTTSAGTHVCSSRKAAHSSNPSGPQRRRSPSRELTPTSGFWLHDLLYVLYEGNTENGPCSYSDLWVQPTKPRPTVTLDGSNRVPYNIRQRYLNSMIDEYLKLCDDEDEAYKQALEEENKAYARANNRHIYLNVACNAIQKLRRRLAEESGGSSQPVVATHDAVLGGAIAARTSFSIEKRAPKPSTELEGPILYKLLKPYVMTSQQLEENNYPMSDPVDPNKAIYPRTKICQPSVEKTCCRCQRKFTLTEEGEYLRPEECTYHWGRIYKKKVAGSWDGRYNCCGMDGEADGCCSSRGHVWDVMEEHHLEGYIATVPRETHEPGVYGVDCEMAYTTDGLELIRVSVVNSRLQSVYETLVKPANPVLDYNTRFSGLTAEDLATVTTRIHNVQAALINLFSNQTILVGHSLESDLRALKLIHRKVVDTSLIFPHRLGLPYKRSLRNLMAEFCSKIIQNGDPGTPLIFPSSFLSPLNHITISSL
ncbi:REXO1 [Cordylochernes scorpioides]|uniref:REXO1 n=1 Tax=Cordylochernes scorpioides TaxID=51811 RepID=A0ABY6K8P8_9ARAC|nr:REXO1 [Cordylochernes scorpioides]